MPADPRKSKRPSRLKGRLLLADPSLHDGIFGRAVVLVTDHSADDGACGIVLNQPTDRLVGDLLIGAEFEPLRSIRVFQGGPCEPDQLKFVAFSWQPSRGLRCAGSLPLEKTIAASRRPGTLVRAFVGYSGWSPGQLESELERNAWVVVKPEADLLGLDHAPPLWADLMRRISPYHRILAASPPQAWCN